METLFKGIKEFNTTDFLEHKDLFQTLGKKQSPHTLFIGCSDSRIVPNLITKSLPGELFVIRNIANLVPYFRESNEFLSSTSAIEYAVEVLQVSNIVVCGHSNCGGCNALYMDEKFLSSIPHTRKWLELAWPVRTAIEKDPVLFNDPVKREWVTEQMNIIEQMNHLLTFPYIKDKYLRNELTIMGWYYIIETGEIFNYDIPEQKFIKVE